MTDSNPESPPLAPIRPEGFFGGARLLAADARVATLLVDDARRRTMERLFGIPRDQDSVLETMIALAMLGGALRSQADRGRAAYRRVRRLNNSQRAMIGFGALREVGYGIAGPSARQTPAFASLIALALLGAGTRVVVRKSVHGVKGASHEAYTDFHHRYGHLIRRNRRRAGAEPGLRERGALPLSDT